MKQTENGQSTDEYGCSACGRTYFLANSLIKHIRYECGGRKRYTCNICNASYTQNGSLRRHLSNNHNVSVPPRQKFVLPFDID